MKTRKFIVSVLIENRFDEMSKVIEYIGENPDKIIDAIIEKHSYGLDDEDKANFSFKEKMKHISKNNGDGCDYILSIIFENQVIFSGAFDDNDDIDHSIVEQVEVMP